MMSAKKNRCVQNGLRLQIIAYFATIVTKVYTSIGFNDVGTLTLQIEHKSTPKAI